MGFFSWNCRVCGHSIMNPYAFGDMPWLNEAVALFPDGTRLTGRYDGYGRIAGRRTEWGVEVELMHQKCWREQGERGYEKTSPSARGQGHFYDDGDTPEEERWQNTLGTMDDALQRAAEQATERERKTSDG